MLPCPKILPSCFPTETLYFFLRSVCATCPAHLFLLDFMFVIDDNSNSFRWFSSVLTRKCHHRLHVPLFELTSWFIVIKSGTQHQEAAALADVVYFQMVFFSGVPTCYTTSFAFLNPLALELDIYSSAHQLCKMWIFYERRRVTMGNTRYFVEE